MVALIPARGGSEGVPRKNLADVGGMTLTERAIRSANECSYISSVVVSSDDQEILDLAQRCGATPLVRPGELASGTARAEGVVEHFLTTPLGSTLAVSDVIVYLQPTSPFRSSSHVTASLEAMFRAQADSLVSVKDVTEHPAKIVTVGAEGMIQSAPYGADSSANRQQLPTLHYPTGAIYAFTVESFRREQKIPIFEALPFLMRGHDSLDIDNPDDLMIARAVADYAHL